VLKAKPIVELVNGTLPPRPNGIISKVSFFQGCGFFELIIKGFVLIMELLVRLVVWCDYPKIKSNGKSKFTFYQPSSP
jgi:hypothetical protein